MPISLELYTKKCLFMAICALMLQGYQAQGLDTSAQHPATIALSKIQPGFNWNYLGENLPPWESLISKVPSWSTVTSKVSSKMPAAPSFDLKGTATQAGKSLLSKAPKVDTSSWTLGNAFNYVRPSNTRIAQGLSLLILVHLFNGQKNLRLIKRRYAELLNGYSEFLEKIKSNSDAISRYILSQPDIPDPSIKYHNTQFIHTLTQFANQELNNNQPSNWPLALIANDINISIKQLNGWIPATFGLINQASSNRLPNVLSQSFKDLRKQLIDLRTYIQAQPTYIEQQNAFKADQKATEKKLKEEKVEEQKKKKQDKEEAKRKEELHQAKLKTLQAQEKAAKEQPRAPRPPSYQESQQR